MKLKALASRAPKSRGRAWRIHITIESRALKISAATIRKISKQVLRELESEIAIPEVNELHVMIINDAKMREINFEFRQKDKATDVLSFPQYEPKEIRGVCQPKDAPNSYLGDLVISSETTKRQAKRFGVTLQKELSRLITHGILHLTGYDHEGVPAREAQAMRRRERAILKVITQS